MSIPVPQIREINQLLLAYSDGNYRKKGRISNKRNEADFIISGLNMLGEELLATTVSSDYFSSIYNAVANMLFVLSPQGKVQNVNNSVGSILKLDCDNLINKNISEVVSQKPKKFFAEIKKQLQVKPSVTLESTFVSSQNKRIPVSCVFSRILDRHNILKGYLLVAIDITERKNSEQKVLRAIIDTQEKERLRIHKDLHDAVGQKIGGILLYLNSLKAAHGFGTEKYNETIKSVENSVKTATKTIRSVCFDLMPGKLKNENIVAAIKDLLNELQQQNILQFHFRSGDNLPALEKPLEIVIYRLVQEFISNTIKHANAKNIIISLFTQNNSLILQMKDDGSGFNPEKKLKGGNGLNNIASRVRAFNGTYQITSKKNRGTTIDIVFALD